MNIQHSKRTDRWFTPQDIIARTLVVLGEIDLDPASELLANKRIGAKRFFSREQNGLLQNWEAESILLNPPGGKDGNKSISAMFWDKLMCSLLNLDFGHAIFLAFSLEQLQTTQKSRLSLAHFPLVIPRKRIRFDMPNGNPGPAPSHSNVIAYVPGYIDHTKEFSKAFGDLGALINC